MDQKGFISCTPAGIIQLLKRSGIEIAGKECVIIGRSNIVGKPMAMLLLRENGTVTVCHSRTKDLKEVTKRADILVVAIGKPPDRHSISRSVPKAVPRRYPPAIRKIRIGYRTPRRPAFCGHDDAGPAENASGFPDRCGRGR